MNKITKSNLKFLKNDSQPILHSIEGGKLLLMLEIEGKYKPVYDNNNEIMSFHNLAEARAFTRNFTRHDPVLEQQQFFSDDSYDIH